MIGDPGGERQRRIMTEEEVQKTWRDGKTSNLNFIEF